MSTRLPGLILFPRLFVGLVLVVDSLRGWGINAFLGSSAIEDLGLSHVFLVKTLCVIQGLLAIFIVVGYLTRLAVIPVMAQWAIEASASWARVGSLSTSVALDKTLLATGVISVCVLLLFGGAGAWSADANLS
jgi:hypothetical protein